MSFGKCDTDFDRVYVDRQSNRARVLRDGRLVYRYRLVIEEHLSRPLAAGEHVHHVNGDTTDDRLVNLKVLSTADHGALHGRLAWLSRKAGWEDPWAEFYSECVDCGTTRRPHQGHGLCSRCHSRVRARRYRARKAAA